MRNYLCLFFILFYSFGCSSPGNPTLTTSSAPNPSALIGQWKVDLRPKPSSTEYFQTFIVSKIEGNKISGSFYGTPFENGHINADWDTVYFAFTTQDLSGPYQHSGKLGANGLEGLSHSPGRDFLARWTARKEK
jgi:hypothetical protein